MLHSLHMLRAIAAFAVVYFHVTSTAGLKLEWDIGSRGVDVFFVISGFIISYVGRGEPGLFLRRRLIRIIPFYWMATVVVFAAATLLPQMFRSTTANIGHLLLSLLFIPHTNPASGEMMPTLVLGWSLNFEMFFYIVFTLSMLISQRLAPLLSAIIIVLIVLLIKWSGLSNEILAFYGRPIVLEFCYGVLVYYIFEWCSSHRGYLSRSSMLKWTLFFALIGNLIVIAVLEKIYGEHFPRYVAAGVPAFFIVLSAVLLERVYGLAAKSSIILGLGEASYIVYLIHPYIVFGILRVWVGEAVLNTLETVGLILFLMTLTGLISYLIHAAFERPVMRFLRSKWAS